MNCVIACNKNWCSNILSNHNDSNDFQFTIIDKKQDLTISLLEKVKPDYIFFPHWSYLIPEEIYSQYECIVFHMTDLPYGRGGSPLQNLIIRGHKETMLSALKCEKGFDTGPIYLKAKLSLIGTAEEILFRASRLIESMIIRVISEKPKPKNQKGKPTTFNRRTAEDNNWSLANSLDEVFDRIRMLDSKDYPAAFVQIGQYKLEFSNATREAESVVSSVKIIKIEE